MSRVGSGTPPAVSEQHRAFGSHLIRSGPWSFPRRSSWRSIFGTIDLDLRQARLADAETLLEVYNLFGTVTVIVPDGLDVVVRGGGMFASQKIESPERPPIAGGPSLTIDTRGAALSAGLNRLGRAGPPWCSRRPGVIRQWCGARG